MAASREPSGQLELPVDLPAALPIDSPFSNCPTDLTAKLTPTIEETIGRLRKKAFIVDPIAGQFISRIVSVMSSAYKRHGNILERAIFERLSENPELEVWRDSLFSVSSMADNVASESLKRPSSLLETNIPYEPIGKRTLQVDVIVFDKGAKTLRAYEVKRGNGEHDAGKKRQILRDTLCIQVLLKKYGIARGYEPSSVSSHVIGYYGLLPVRPPFGLKGTDLDQHFGFSIYKEVEK